MHEPLKQVALSDMVLSVPLKPLRSEGFLSTVLPAPGAMRSSLTRWYAMVPHIYSLTFIPPIHSQKDHPSAGPYDLILHSSIPGSFHPSKIQNLFRYYSQTTVQKLFMAPNFLWFQLFKI